MDELIRNVEKNIAALELALKERQGEEVSEEMKVLFRELPARLFGCAKRIA
jgi:hypothetical protein